MSAGAAKMLQALQLGNLGSSGVPSAAPADSVLKEDGDRGGSGGRGVGMSAETAVDNTVCGAASSSK